MLDASAKLPETRLDFVNGNRLTSYSGADFLVLGYRPTLVGTDGQPLRDRGGEPASPAFVEFANIQTVSVSSTRDVYAERVLGSAWVRRYERGGRTVAGSMAFTMFDGDSLRKLAGARLESSREDLGYYMPDDIPEFNVVLSATNEYGQTVSGIILGITIVNAGSTVGVQDIFTEQMYSYVARRWIPFVGTLDLTRRLSQVLGSNPFLTRIMEDENVLYQWKRDNLTPIDQETLNNHISKVILE